MTGSHDGRSRPVRIIHLGLGRFFRAHQAWYTAHAADAADWGIAAFTVRSPRVAEDLAAQDFMYRLIVRGPESDDVEIIPSVVAAHPGTDLDALRDYASRPEVAVITLTVTEGGYGLDGDGDPDVEDADVRADLATLRSGGTGIRTVLGRLVVALQARRAAHAGPIAVVPCDNIPGNGGFVADGLTAFAAAVDPVLAEWMTANVSFVSTSVDRITPVTTDGAVITEPFSDWVLAGGFPAGRPAWETAGARFVDDIESWENRKLWLLNGAHLILAFAGLRKGIATVADAIDDPRCRALVEDFWAEAVRVLPTGTEHERYRHRLVARFANRRIVHPLSQIAADATTKVKFRFAAVAERTLQSGSEPDASARAMAAWIRWNHTAGAETDARAAEIDAAVRSGDPVRSLVDVVSPRLAASDLFLDKVRMAVSAGSESIAPVDAPPTPSLRTRRAPA